MSAVSAEMRSSKEEMLFCKSSMSCRSRVSVESVISLVSASDSRSSSTMLKRKRGKEEGKGEDRGSGRNLEGKLEHTKRQDICPNILEARTTTMHMRAPFFRSHRAAPKLHIKLH